MSRFKDALPLHVFIRQRQVIHMYRKSLKAIKKVVPETVRGDLLAEIQREYRKCATIQDSMTVKSLIVHGERSLKQIKDMAQIESAVAVRVGTFDKEIDADSWLNQSDEHDQRGRVGTGWPWGG